MPSRLAAAIAIAALVILGHGHADEPQAIARPKAPAIKDRDWVQIPFDVFVLAKLEATGVKPAPAASPDELVQRVTQAIAGRDPSPIEIETFVKSRDKRVYEKTIDRLLEEPGFAKRFERALSLVKEKTASPHRERAVTSACWTTIFGRELKEDHPDAFAWLACELVDPTLVNCCDLDHIPQAWDVKHLVKAIVVSAVFRQTSARGPQ